MSNRCVCIQYRCEILDTQVRSATIPGANRPSENCLNEDVTFRNAPQEVPVCRWVFVRSSSCTCPTLGFVVPNREPDLVRACGAPNDFRGFFPRTHCRSYRKTRIRTRSLRSVFVPGLKFLSGVVRRNSLLLCIMSLASLSKCPRRSQFLAFVSLLERVHSSP